MSSSPPGVPPMPLVGVDFDSSVVSRPRNYQRGKEKPFLKPYFDVTSVPVHPVIHKQFPKYKTQVIHVRPWKLPEQAGPKSIEPSTQPPRGRNYTQSHFYVDDPLEQEYSKEPASEISGPVPLRAYGYNDQPYDQGGKPDFKFYDDVDYEEQPFDSDYPEFSEPYRFTEFRNNDRPLHSVSHSIDTGDYYPPIIIAGDDFFRSDSRSLPPRGRIRPHAHVRKDEDNPSPGIRKIIRHIRENIHEQVVKETEIASLLVKPPISRPHEDHKDDFPDNIQEIKKLINHPGYPLDYHRSTVPSRQRRPPFRFP